MTPPLAPRGPGADGAPGTGGAPGIGGAPGSRGAQRRRAPGSPARRAVGAGVLAVGVVAAAVVLRAPITAVPPALHAISLDLGLSAAAAGATTSLPLVCFGIFAFVAPIARRACRARGDDGAARRAAARGRAAAQRAGGAVAFYTGALLIGVGIAIGNVVLPALIRARFPGHLALMLGVYVAVLQISGAVGSAADPLQGVARLGLAACARGVGGARRRARAAVVVDCRPGRAARRPDPPPERAGACGAAPVAVGGDDLHGGAGGGLLLAADVDPGRCCR